MGPVGRVSRSSHLDSVPRVLPDPILSLRREWATRSAHSSISTDQNPSGWDHPAPLASMMVNTSMRHSTPLSHPNSAGTNSSLSNSPYTSPSLISPIYETSNLSIDDSRPPGGYWQQNSTQATGSGTNLPGPPPQLSQPHLSSNPYDVGMNIGGQDPNINISTIPTDQYGGPVYPQMQAQAQMFTPQMGYQETQDMGYIPNHPNHPTRDQGGQDGHGIPNAAGRYVFQPDGSQLYVPYSYEQ